MKRIVVAAVAAGIVALVSFSAMAEVSGHKGAGLKQADANNDGNVSFEELAAVRPSVTREQFNQLDKNGDGVLSKDDHAKGQAAPDIGARAKGDGPNAQKIQKADANGDSKVTFEELSATDPGIDRQRFDRLDRNKDGVLSKEDAGAGPQQGAPGDARAQAGQKLKQADANGDGKVTYEEVAAKKPGFPRESFDRLDRNKDGAISEADHVGQQQTAARGAQAKQGMRQRLQAADTDGDGRVSAEEATKAFPNLPAERFKQMDRNGDGYLSPEDRKQGA